MSETPEGGKSILIASSSLDIATWGPVAEDLTQRGYEVVAYEADKVATNKVPFMLSVDQEHGLVVQYDGLQLVTSGVAAAWWRRPSMFAPDQTEWARQFNLNEERRDMVAGLWASVPESAWLNVPARIRLAENKIGQLLVAREVGFSIPQTVVSNQ